MSLSILQKERHLARYGHIAEVLARHGLEYLLSAFGLERFVSLPLDILGSTHCKEAHTPPEHLRMALEEMGATFIKLGQILSTRADLLPPEYLTELAKLQDSAQPIPSGVAQERIVVELGLPLESIFLTFDPQPLAAASLGQAHAATLFDGTEVVVKVRRPGVVEQVEEDLEILQNLAASARRHWEFADRYDLVGLAQESPKRSAPNSTTFVRGRAQSVSQRILETTPPFTSRASSGRRQLRACSLWSGFGELKSAIRLR